jgi:phospholipid/cholesterol/gamma-HCH transport system substrate-binding protein
MTEKNLNLKTGLFVTFGIVLLLSSILLFGGARDLFRSYVFYQVEFRSTQGLSRGSVVSLSGMEVGHVTDISFSDKALLVARLRIDKTYSPLITTKSIATIRTQGALGDKFIYINPGETRGETIAPEGLIPTETTPDLIEMITQGKGPDFSLVLSTLHELNTLLNNLNSNGKSAQLMGSLVGASQNVSSLVNEPSLHESFDHLKSILSKVDRGQGTLGALINDSTLYNRLVSLVGDEPRNRYLKPLLREAIKQNEKQDSPR